MLVLLVLLVCSSGIRIPGIYFRNCLFASSDTTDVKGNWPRRSSILRCTTVILCTFILRYPPPLPPQFGEPVRVLIRDHPERQWFMSRIQRREVRRKFYWRFRRNIPPPSSGYYLAYSSAQKMGRDVPPKGRWLSTDFTVLYPGR